MLQLNQLRLPLTEENPFDDIAKDLVKPLEGVGDEIVEQVRDSLSVICTVYHQTGLEKDQRHSVAGEHPRYESGALLKSIARSVTTDGSVVTLTVDTDVFYAPILEAKDRPIFKGVLEEYEDRLMEAAHKTIAEE